MTQSTSKVARDVIDNTNQKGVAIRQLLDETFDSRSAIPVQTVRMGETISYLGSAPLKWVAENISFAAELPLFKERLEVDEGDSRIVRISKDTVSILQQRRPDYRREATLVQYLASRTTHKFPPILVVTTEAWVDDPKAPEWNEERRATRTSAHFESLDSEETFGMLRVSMRNKSIRMYALDGQHRLMAIKGLMRLLDNGRIPFKNADGKEIPNKYLTTDEIVEKYSVHGINHGYLQSLANETIGIEFIAAVNQDETREEALRRIRSTFVHVNKNAVQLTGGELAQLNEDNGFVLIARNTALNHTLLEERKDGKDRQRVNMKNATVAKRSTVVTTLQTLEEMARRYLEKYNNFDQWIPSDKALPPIRPEDDEIEEGQEKFDEFWDNVELLPVFERFEQGADITKLRGFRVEADSTESEAQYEAHLLLRPVGQIVIAEVVGELHFKENMPLDQLFRKLRRMDTDGLFSVDQPKSPWYGVLYDFHRHKMYVPGRDLAIRVLRYMLGARLAEEERNALRDAFAEARTTRDDRATNLLGEEVIKSEISLPDAL